MTPLTVSEKERVAGLLGDNVRWQCACGASYETRNQGERNCGEVSAVVTLEACMEYAKGKGWDVELTMWHEPVDHPGQAWWDAQINIPYDHRPLADITSEEGGPLCAMVRALLKAEEASRE